MKLKIKSDLLNKIKNIHREEFLYLNSKILDSYAKGKLISFYDETDKNNFFIFEIVEIQKVNFADIKEPYIINTSKRDHWYKLRIKKDWFDLSMVDNFVFDMDGTLLNENKAILKENIDALKELKKMGKNIIVATGRPLYTLHHIEEVPTEFPIICSNGAIIYNKDHSLLKAYEIDKETVKSIYKYLKSQDMEFLMYSPNYVLGCENSNCKYLEMRNYAASVGENYKQGEFFNELEKYRICKFLIHIPCTTEEKLANLKEYLKQFDVYLVRSQSTLADIMRTDATKGEAVKNVAQKYNLDLNRTICFGDAENDTSMFSISKYSASPSSGNIKAKNRSLLRVRNHQVAWLKEFVEQFKD
ncbi:Cof-type HAD-IIB family hydrolase [Mycoplasmopsis fermentans]|uniref:Uncharacterized protein n=2 Tax=Mycoplasmopsis fermentans TaxID=2115 RepID=C4XDW6_MYCFP|nr:Cof-type HAD-IIB family hydrolase [Mycoplasmopsis fermentans]VEU67126.1 putative phosphotransferase [Mesomycoplasma conjunctivae]ADV34646.1 Conserved Hypothetical Protein [Mycoplasmopsis fermentans M64]RMX35329.1 HAD hydrolase, IIB family protein [Mycoplasmopsis fermentans MF-I2]RMX35470.1 HAD hydrolase, IIB family protein [Mycoplasmopsis fermentans MF-I1]VEU63884.1 putative phosphotransferase [Mycoplasmopsis fermentans]